MPAIVRRDVRFALPPDRIGDWHVNGVANTHYFNALSLMFPAGERFSSMRFATTGIAFRIPNY